MKIAPSSSPSAQAPTNPGTGAARTAGVDAAANAAAGVDAAANAAAGATATGVPANAAAAGGGATVNLSGLSGQLRALAASGAADIDTALVQSIRDALKDGTLTIDASKIADGVLNTARELLQPPSAG